MRTVLLILVALFVGFSCRRSEEMASPVSEIRDDRLQSCDFGQTGFNVIQRDYMQEETGSPEEITGDPKAVLLLDFNGHTVANTPWNYNGSFTCSPANLSPAEITEVINRVKEDFSVFDIEVTTSENLYNQCNPYRRMRVIITETWQWFGQTGGTAFFNSFTWGDNTPCFVFSVLLNYVPKKIAEAVSHEAGHTLGLYHQSVYDPSCFLLNEYHTGLGSGQLSWAPIMGVGYTRNMTTWRRGSCINGCNNIQDDVNILSTILEFRDDDHSNDFSQAKRVNSGSETGCINSSSDIDMFMVDRTGTSFVTVTPFGINGNNEGANLDIKIRIYSRDRSLLMTVNDPSALSVSASLPPGRSYISVESTENENATRYGQLGNYTLSIN